MNREKKVHELFHFTPTYSYWGECIHGVARSLPATAFPIPLALAATWDPRLMFTIATAISDEARAIFNLSKKRNMVAHCLSLHYYAPNINIYRHAGFGRGMETYGAIPFLTARLTAQFVHGMQGNHPQYKKTICCLKHLAAHSGNSQETRRYSFDAQVTPLELWNIYLPAFKKGIEAGAGMVMSAYNALNGIPCTAHKWLLTDLLRGRWGFKGFVVSDWGTVEYLHMHHKYSASLPQAFADAFNAGIDQNLGRDDLHHNLLTAVQQGFVTEARLDEALNRLYTSRRELGEGQTTPWDNLDYHKVVGSPRHRKLALRAAEQSIILLKNKNQTLPIPTNIKSLAMIGQNATLLETMLGNYHANSPRIVTHLEGVAAKAREYGIQIRFNMGWLARGHAIAPENYSIGESLCASHIVAFAGHTPMDHGEEGDALRSNGGDMTDIRLPDNQVAVLRELHSKMQPPQKLILVLTSGGPIDFSAVEDIIDAVLLCWYPGEEGGTALANIIFGQTMPCGKLPMTFPARIDPASLSNYHIEEAHLLGPYMNDDEIAYPDGFGLSYTTFSYSNMQIQPDRISIGEKLRAKVTLQNTNVYTGAEIAQLYLSYPPAAHMPRYELIGTKRIVLKPGQKKKLTFDITQDLLQRYDENGNPFTLSGEYTLHIGGCAPVKRAQELGMSQPAQKKFRLF